MNRIILVGKGTSGKDYLRKKFEGKGFKYQISYTTRPPREGEVDGVDYYFITQEQADWMTLNDEWKHLIYFNEWAYGTTKIQFYDTNCPLFLFTPKAIKLISEEDLKSSFIIYLKPDESVILNRLAKRKMPGDSAERRYAADLIDFADFNTIDLKITNSDF